MQLKQPNTWGDPQKCNYLLEGGPLYSTGFPCCVSVPGTHLYQCTSWHCCEGLHSASVNSFMKTLSTHLPISWWVFYEHTCPHHVECSVFDQKWHDLVPHPISPSNVFLFPLWKKSSGKRFADVEEVIQMAEALKHIRIEEFKNCFEQWKKVLIGVFHPMGRVLWRWLKFKHVRINTQTFINKFWVFLIPPLYVLTFFIFPGNYIFKISWKIDLQLKYIVK